MSEPGMFDRLCHHLPTVAHGQ